MPTLGLLSIDPDKLFEEFSIAEIEDVQKKLQSEIERKREELRTMVGERYRDLIEAADTISEMKLLSEKLIEDVNRMKTATGELQERQVSGFNIESHPKDVKSSNNQLASAAAQVRLLIDIPEHIWEAVDQSNYTRAALLFLLSRYIKTSLEINPIYQTTKNFPIVARQWSSLAHFKTTIQQGAEVMLKSHLSSQAFCSGLVCLALLESQSPAHLLERLLTLRSAALRASLDTSQPLDSAAIQQRLRDSYMLLVHSITAVSDCFLEHVQAKNGLLFKELLSHVGPQAPPMITLLNQVACDVSSLLPAAMKEFRPAMESKGELEWLGVEQVCQSVSVWVTWVRGYVQQQGSQLLQQLSSLRSLQGLQDPPQVSEEWPIVAAQLQVPVDLWSELYRSLVTDRAQQMVSVHWDAAFKILQQQIEEAYRSACAETRQTEVDLTWHMWKEAASDLSHTMPRGLWAKARGVTPSVVNLCAGLELKVCSLLGDLSALCPDQELDPGRLAVSLNLRAHQQTVCSQLIDRLVQFVKELVESSASEAGALLLAKFLQSVPELCPSLSKCLSADSKCHSWQESQSLLQSACLSLYKTWLSVAKGRVLKQVTDTLGHTLPGLRSIPQWEEIKIEEEGELGEKLESVLKVPSVCSINLHSALYTLVTVTSRVAIPKQVSEQIIDYVIASIVGIYVDNLDDTLTQTQYLQMLLDVKYLAQLFHNTTSKETKLLCQETVLKLEAKIDPFDFNVFLPYLNNNVKVAVDQTQGLLGVPGPQMQVSGSNSAHKEEPHVLAVSSTTAWFPLLHITAPRPTTSTHITPAKSKSKKSANVPSIAPSTDPSPKQSNTSSFFGVMTSDWFG